MTPRTLEDTAIWRTIEDIIYSDYKPARRIITGELHTEKTDFPIVKITHLDTVRDYINNIGDIIHVEFKMSLGDYMDVLYPYRHNLEFSLKVKVLSDGDTPSKVKPGIDKFKAVFLPEANHNVGASETKLHDPDSMNMVDFIDVKLQLLNRSLEPLRIKTVMGIFKNASYRKLMYNIVGGESIKVLVDGKPAIDAIDIVEPDNKIPPSQVVFPSSMPIVSIPTYLQEQVMGVYNAGIGTYLQVLKSKRIWYIYPLYNTGRFEKDSVDKIIFYVVPEKKLQLAERTYHVDGKVTNVIVASDREYIDSAETTFMNKGVGFKLGDAQQFMTKPVKIVDEPKGPKSIKTDLNYQVMTVKRKDDLHYVPMSTERISGNPFVEYTNVIVRKGAVITITWQNSNYNAIYPGMPCRYIYMANNKPMQIDGIIIHVHAIETLHGKGIIDSEHKSSCIVTMFVVPSTSKPVPLKSKPFTIF